MNKHIILMGFKHAGKTVIGQQVAAELQMPFFDTDHELEILFAQEKGVHLACRKIMAEYGSLFFKMLETSVLKKILLTSPAVIALGGGTPLWEDHQQLIKKERLIQVMASKSVIYQRIVAAGGAAFFNESIREFNQLWQQRQKIYQQLTPLSVTNNTTVAAATHAILQLLIPEVS